MDDLKRRLTKELQHDINVKIMDSLSWSLPVRSVDIAFNTVLRRKMDVFMKMMLITIQKTEIEKSEELSDILLVEQLFIEDLISKMTRVHMIEKRGNTFALTDRGTEQLESNLFEHEPESNKKTMLYSPWHEDFLNKDLTEGSSEEKNVYRYAKEFADWDVTSLKDSKIINALQSLGIESEEGNFQTVISDILSVSNSQINFIPCMEFRLHHKEEDLIYARVWNTLTERWDEKLEAQLNEKERKVWRESYL